MIGGMKRLFSVFLFALLLLGVLAYAAPAEAANCYLHYNGTYVCDARPRLPDFSTPRYPRQYLLYPPMPGWPMARHSIAARR